MNLLFDINASEASELHDVLGFVDADFSLVQILPYLKKSTRELTKWIGSNNYDKAFALYEEENSEDEFLQLCRYSIALGAFREFMPLADVSYTTQGRAFRADENLKACFEWMIDNSNEAMERSYYASINEVITYVAETSGYETSPKIQKIKELFVSSLDIFQDYVDINDSYYLFFKLGASLRLAEQQLISGRVGSKFITYKESNNTPINDTIKNICVYFAMADGLKKNSVQLFPRGVMKEVKSSSRQKQATQYDVEATAQYYLDELKILLNRLETAVAKDKQIISNKRAVNFDDDSGYATI